VSRTTWLDATRQFKIINLFTKIIEESTVAKIKSMVKRTPIKETEVA
jgi:hypothetical protein